MSESITNRMIEALLTFRQTCEGPARFELAGKDWMEFRAAMERELALFSVQTEHRREHPEFYGCPVHRIVGGSGIRVRAN